MWNALFVAVTRLFTACNVFFGGLENYAKAFTLVSVIAVEVAGEAADDSRINRIARLKARNLEAGTDIESVA